MFQISFKYILFVLETGFSVLILNKGFCKLNLHFTSIDVYQIIYVIGNKKVPQRAFALIFRLLTIYRAEYKRVANFVNMKRRSIM